MVKFQMLFVSMISNNIYEYNIIFDNVLALRTYWQKEKQNSYYRHSTLQI